MSLSDLEDKLRDVSILSENRLISEEQRRKISILKNLLLQQKNIFIENISAKMKAEILINNPYLDIKNIIEKEEIRRKNLQNDFEKQYCNNPKIFIEDKDDLLSLFGIELQIKIFRKQKICETPGIWTDYLFGPQTISLCPYNSNGFLIPEGINYYELKDWMKYKWLRPEILFDSPNYQIKSEEISPNDIIPGFINDTYFLTAIISLCKYPKIINNLLFVKEKTKEHLYGIYFNIHG